MCKHKVYYFFSKSKGLYSASVYLDSEDMVAFSASTGHLNTLASSHYYLLSESFLLQAGKHPLSYYHYLLSESFLL